MRVTRYHKLILSALLWVLPHAALAQDGRALSAEVMVLERLALPDNTILMVDVTDAQDRRVAALRVPLDGAQSPFPFDLNVPTDTARYLRAGVSAGDGMIWLTDPIALEQGNDPLGLGTLRAVRSPNMGAAHLLSCGGQLAEIGFLPEQARLRFNENTVNLSEQPAASGAYYVAPDNPNTSIHMKGDSALIRIDGAELAECQVISPEDGFSSSVWNITAIEDRPALFPSRTELVFFPDGRFAATMGCNRFLGNFRRHGGILMFGQAASTLMGCSDGLADQEQRFAQMIQAVDGYTLNPEGSRLTLTVLGQPAITAQRNAP